MLSSTPSHYPIPLLPPPLKEEKPSISPPLQREGQGGGGVRKLSVGVVIITSIIKVDDKIFSYPE